MGTDTHAMVEQVKIEHVDALTVSFTTRSASKSGTPDDCLLKTFRCAISEVWTAPIPGAPPPVAMKSGAIGNLFLSRDGWQTMSEDGYKIFGVDTDLALFKYPNAAAGPRSVNRLAVRLLMIAVHRILHGSDRRIDIDLVGPDAAQAQDIAWTGAA